MAASTKVSDMCRLCGTDTLNVVRHHIFEGEGQVKKSAQKISECLPLHIAAEDPLPKNICGECSYKLDLMSDFREKAVKTDVMLVSLVEGVKPEIPDDDDDGPDHEIDNDFRSDTPVEQPEQQTEPEVLIKEEEAQQPQQPEKRPGRKAANKRPIQESDMEEEEEEAPAKKRGRKPKEKETAPAASATTSASTNPPKENTGEAASASTICSQKPCTSIDEKARRKTKMTKNPCDMCSKVFSTPEILNSHVLKCHCSTAMYQCTKCKDIVKAANLRDHRAQHGMVEPFSLQEIKDGTVRCEICNMEFGHNLIPHMLSTHDFQMYVKCIFCGSIFKDKKAFLVHVASHANSDTLVSSASIAALQKPKVTSKIPVRETQATHYCYICNVGFPSSNILSYHTATRHNIIQTPTFSVGKQTSDNNEAPNTHQSSVPTSDNKSPVAMHKCDRCCHYFRSAEALEEHQTKGSSRCKQHACCIVCKKHFPLKASLKNHQIHAHSPNFTQIINADYYVRPEFIKVECQESFPDELNWADRPFQQIIPENLSGEKQFSCSLCRKTFNSQRMLNLHTLMHQSVVFKAAQSAEIE
ncbi:oocyte zinc finger protein XlCOF7.1-like isoform X13 [Cloeon dipterum]|uniref:oocyte zinc finger protein XlCOF7.1-like isoform X13 n=1 Tax=Cloeon dipterum TaxID=197152 RepID=UPI00321FB7EF